MQFRDDDAFKPWLHRQSPEVCVAIATRAALRVMPLLAANSSWKDTKDGREAQARLVLLTGWCTLISGFASTCPSPEIKNDAVNATDAVSATAAAAAAAATATATAATDASLATPFATHAANAAATHAANAYAAATDATYSDCDFMGEGMLRQPLWHDAGVPVGLRPEDLGPTLFDTDPRFAFFARWYDGMARGEPLDWELQRRVALIPEETWRAGVDAVAAAIAEIEARFAVQSALVDLARQRIGGRVDRFGIGGNNPPEEVDLPPDVLRSETIIRGAVEDIAEEVESEEPDRGRIVRALEAIKAALVVVAKWTGRKVDLAVDTIIKDGIGTAIKSGAALFALDRLVQAVEGWLPFLK
ncbi:hypothetical protein [Sagittula salina]|uniref:Uncharacterized protein n=1 Tax=Sagittula salina TaxID=2820268 RepID=A0A940MQL4_9RHOB|nr:hypothetical protein [Sagittula salina]MBP0484020.1 hypothetical protein [Sagittula salina]